jgi:hypothetical protein
LWAALLSLLRKDSSSSLPREQLSLRISKRPSGGLYRALMRAALSVYPKQSRYSAPTCSASRSSLMDLKT